MLKLHGSAPAKINLALQVLNRRPDGYHEIRSVLQTISLADGLSVAYQSGRSAGVALSCDDPALAGDDNLAARAAKQLLEAGGWRGRVAITLQKKIPMGAGLGGGSSDAAAVLLALRRLLRPAPPVEMLYQTAAALGSDVPFFLVGGTAVAVGRGEEVYPLADLPRLWILLLLPAIHVSTAEAYAEIGDSRRALTARNSRNMIEVFCSRVSVPADSRTPHVTLPFQNDFEEAVFRRFPRLNEWKKHLIRAGASPALMSGSGSALFGVFPDRRTALQVRDSFGKFPGKALVVRGISRKAYHALWNR